jgi:hypothetical protein
MLCVEITAVYSEAYTKHVRTMCGWKVEFLNVKPEDT